MLNAPPLPKVCPLRHFSTAAALGWVTACGPAVGPLSDGADAAGERRLEAVAPVLAGVVRAGDGAPVPGAHLTSVPDGHEATSDAYGAFQFSHLPPGAHALVVAASGYQTIETAPVDVIAGELATVDVVLDLPAEVGPRVTVTVQAPDGSPAVGVSVRYLRGDGTEAAVVSTDDAGEAGFLVTADGAPRLVVDDPEGRWLSRSLDLGPLTDAGGAQWTVQLSGHAVHDSAYLGSEACGVCHADAYAGWSESRHARALLAAPGAVLQARFEAGAWVDLERGGASATLSTNGTTRVAVLRDSTGATLSLTIEGFIGDDRSRSVPWAQVDDQGWPLPFAWVAEDPSRPGWPAEGGLLVPFEADRWLDADGRLVARSGARSAEAQCFGCHATGFELTIDDDKVELTATRSFGRWQEGAVGCERCHGPGADHRAAAATGEVRDLIVQPARLDPARASDVCGQCHTSRQHHDTDLPFFHRDGRPFLPGEVLAEETAAAAVFWPEGAAASPHSEVEELESSAHGLLGLGCADCHDAHGTDGHDALLRLPGRANDLCLDCHLSLDFAGDPDVAEAHTAHVRQDPTGPTEGGRCVGCHMPGTATAVFWNPLSGAGELSSHRFEALPPADTLAVFGDADTLPVGAAPAHACGDCHAWLALDWERRNVVFPGPASDPTLRVSHEAHQAAFEEKYP